MKPVSVIRRGQTLQKELPNDIQRLLDRQEHLRNKFPSRSYEIEYRTCWLRLVQYDEITLQVPEAGVDFLEKPVPDPFPRWNEPGYADAAARVRHNHKQFLDIFDLTPLREKMNP